MSKPINPAAALARLRWANTTPEQRKAAMKVVHEASPRTKFRVCPGCGGRLWDLRAYDLETQLAARADGKCFAHTSDSFECHGEAQG